MKKSFPFFVEMKDYGLRGLGKVGAVNWTIGKLLNIILLVLLLVLVIYGVTTHGLNPLIKNLGQKFDDAVFMLKDVSSRFGLGNSPYNNCYVASVAGIDGGPKFLKELGLDSNSDVVINYGCDNVCNISGADLGEYRVKEGAFERFEKGEWVEYDLSPKEMFKVKFRWELYNGATNILDEGPVREIYNKMVTKSFVLYGDGVGIGKDVFAIWRNGVWVVREGNKVIYNGISDDYALSLFKSRVDTMYDDHVFFKESAPEIRGVESIGENVPTKEYIEKARSGFKVEGVWRPINELVGGTNIELDDSGELDRLKREFSNIKKEMIKESVLSDEDVSNLKSFVDGKSFNIDEDKFILGIEWSKLGYVISISSGSKEKRYGLRFNAYEKLVNEAVHLRNYPLSLVSSHTSLVGSGLRKGSYVTSWVDEGDELNYKMPEDYFKKGYRGYLVGQFLKSKCK